MSKPNLDDYITVNERIAKFYDSDGVAIRSRMTYDDGQKVQFRACAHGSTAACELDNDGNCLNAIGTGTAEEIRGDGFINKTSAVENCETSAIGRALAMAGIEVKKSIASREEVQQAITEQERQDETKKAASQPNGKPITLDAAHAIATRALEVVDFARFRLAATHIAGHDVGEIGSEKDAIGALKSFNQDDAKRLAEWVEKKAAEA